MTSPLADLSDDQVRKLLNVGSAFAALQVAADVVEKTAFDDDDVEAIGWLPLELRMHTIARIIDAAEAIREELREIDGRTLLLTGTETPAA
jgi:hypothetical protein